MDVLEGSRVVGEVGKVCGDMRRVAFRMGVVEEEDEEVE